MIVVEKVSKILPVLPAGFDYSFQTIMFDEDVKKYNYFCSGMYENLKEETIRKINPQFVNWKILKNIPEDLIRKQIDENKRTYTNFVTILFNPFFKSKYRKLMTENEYEMLLRKLNEDWIRVLLYCRYNADFSILNLVKYDIGEDTIYYEDELFDYGFVYFDVSKAFLKKAKFTNEKVKNRFLKLFQ